MLAKRNMLLVPLPIAALLAFGLYLFNGCSTDEAEPRSIRAHALIKQGVPHAEPAMKAERYCVQCHGAGLAGGPKLEPSCYSCHGKNWEGHASDANAAPADHTVDNQGFRHHPSLFSPVGTCEGCHGQQLEGVTASGLTSPGCELCHTKLWEERTP
jgi:hypothetical protein